MPSEINGLNTMPTAASTQRHVAPATPEKRVDGAGKPQASAADMVTISTNAKLLQRPVASGDGAMGVDPRRLDFVKQEIASGRYPVDTKRLSQQVALLKADRPAEGGISRTVEFSRDRNGSELSVTTTGPGGRTRSRESAVSIDRENQTVIRDVTRTGNQGQQVHRHGETVRTENGFTNDLEITLRDGRSMTRQVDQSYDVETGTLTRQVELTDLNGDTVTRTIERTLPRGDDEGYADQPVMPPDAESADV